MQSIPHPKNKKIILKKIDTKKFVVIRFSGRNINENLYTQEKNLIDYTIENKIKIIGYPKYAFYNPPWSLPFMRRNEIMLEIE